MNKRTRSVHVLLLGAVAGLLLNTAALAQTPQKLSYQAVVRNASNQLVANQKVGMQLSIIQGSIYGASVYVETQTPTANANGLVSLEIGVGEVKNGTFATIDWSKGPYFIKTETDPSGGSLYSIVGISQLLSVPYSLYAQKAGEVVLTDAQKAALKGDKGDKGDTGGQGVAGKDGLTTSVNGVAQVNGTITLNKADIGLSNVDNTADAAKPISTAMQTALNTKADKANTLAGYGITDALATATTTTWDKDSSNDVTLTGAQTVTGVKTFSDGIIGNITGNVTGSVNANSTVITNVATPVASTDAANKAYVDVLIARIAALEKTSFRAYTEMVAGISLDLLPITAGTFLMGSSAAEAYRGSDETQYSVTLSKNFYMSKFEVTQQLWTAVMGSNPSYFYTCPTCPVERVSYNDVQNFFAKLNQLTGKTFRLPTEAEWEYAARAGSTSPFNTGTCLTDSQANYDWNVPYSVCTNTVTTALTKTQPVGSYAPNAWGLYDMHGNVFEWCADWYDTYPASAVTDPMGATTGSTRAYRGGGWIGNARTCRSAYRGNTSPSNIYNYLGFRVVLIP